MAKFKKFDREGCWREGTQVTLMDAVLEYMKKVGAPLTREKYLEYAYFGNPPAELSAEEEAELPEEFQLEETEYVED